MRRLLTPLCLCLLAFLAAESRAQVAAADPALLEEIKSIDAGRRKLARMVMRDNAARLYGL